MAERVPDRILERAFLRDPGGQLQVQDMAAQTFKPYSGTLTLGNGNTVTWLRLTVQPAATGQWVLLLQPTLIQDARVHAPRADGSWAVHQLGSKFPHSQRLGADLNHVAPLALGGSQPVTVYVRVHTPSALVLARVVSAAEATELDARTQAAVGLYAGIGVTLLLLSLVGWLATREPLWFFSGLLDTTNVWLMAGQMGVVAKYLLPDTLNVVNRMVMVSGVASIAALCAFVWCLLRLFGARRWCYAPYVLTVLACPLLVLLMMAGKPGLGLAINNLIVLLLSVWGLLMIWFVRPEDRGLRWLWRGMTAVLCGYALFWVSPFVLQVQSTQLSLYPAFPSNLFTALTTAAIAARYTVVRSRSLRAAEQARRDADQRLAQERVRHEQTSGFLGMLVHELRNPLAMIQAMGRRIADARTHGDAAQQPQALATIDRCAGDIGAMLDRSVETDQLDRGALQVRPQAEDAAQRLRDWLVLHRERERIHAELPATLVATIDAGLWLSMVRNLVENALKYGPPGSTAQLRLHDGGGDLLCVDVANAVGNAGRPDPAKVFGKYYRAAGTEGISGTGLGLYWVDQLSQRLGGGLHYLQTPEPGATEGDVVFRLRLPM